MLTSLCFSDSLLFTINLPNHSLVLLVFYAMIKKTPLTREFTFEEEIKNEKNPHSSQI